MIPKYTDERTRLSRIAKADVSLLSADSKKDDTPLQCEDVVVFVGWVAYTYKKQRIWTPAARVASLVERP